MIVVGPQGDDRVWRRLAVVIVTMAAAWYAAFVLSGPTLAINHDELSFLNDALRLLHERRLSGYTRGPFLYEVIAVAEAGSYAVARISGAVRSPVDFLTQFIAYEWVHLRVGRAIVGASAVLLLIQVYRLGVLFGVVVE